MSKRRNAPLKGARAIGSNMTEVEHGDLTILYSYKTPVAILAPSGGYRTQQNWSVTTSKHIRKFFDQNGYDFNGAKKIPQQDIEAFARAGEISATNPPDEYRGAAKIVFTSKDMGTFIDGAHGEAHAIRKMAGLIAEVLTPEASVLLEEYENDAVDDEYAQEWLDNATDELYEATEEGLNWVWDGGDLILTDEEE